MDIRVHDIYPDYSRFIFYLDKIENCQNNRKFCIKHPHHWITNSFSRRGAEDLVLLQKLQADNHSMQLFSHFGKNTSYDLHMWRQYCHLLECIPSLVRYIWTMLDPQYRHRDGFCLEQFLRVQVPLGCVKTAFVSQARICQDNGSEYTQVCLGTALLTLQRTTKAIAHMNTDWRVGKAQYAEFNVPTCGKIAVWQLCRERQPLWNSHDSSRPELNMFGSMPWCSFLWHKLLPRPAQKNCCTV